MDSSQAEISRRLAIKTSDSPFLWRNCALSILLNSHGTSLPQNIKPSDFELPQNMTELDPLLLTYSCQSFLFHSDGILEDWRGSFRGRGQQPVKLLPNANHHAGPQCQAHHVFPFFLGRLLGFLLHGGLRRILTVYLLSFDITIMSLFRWQPPSKDEITVACKSALADQSCVIMKPRRMRKN